MKIRHMWQCLRSSLFYSCRLEEAIQLPLGITVLKRFHPWFSVPSSTSRENTGHSETLVNTRPSGKTTQKITTHVSTDVQPQLHYIQLCLFCMKTRCLVDFSLLNPISDALRAERYTLRKFTFNSRN